MWIVAALVLSGQMGQISFPVTGNAQCNQHFTAGMLAMHSFMYERALGEFQSARKADPRCAMARWGEAMSYTHPIWGEENLPESRKALAGLDETTLPRKERAYLATARVLFGDGEPHARFHAWRLAVETMHREFPADDEVSLQLALALMGDSEHFKDTAALMRAGALGLDVFGRKPKHPGAAHYVIHAFDSPAHAVLGLPAADRYAQIAPAASHALHMPSHIFVQLGMWERVARSNEAAWAASKKDAAGKTIGDYDWHSYSWLMAAYLELGQRGRAEVLLRDLRDRLLREDVGEVRFSYVAMAHLFVTETGAWNRLDELIAPAIKPLPKEPGDPAGSLGCAQHAPGGALTTRYPIGLSSMEAVNLLRAVGAMLRGDEAGVQHAIDADKPIEEAIAAWKGMMPSDRGEKRRLFSLALLSTARAYKTRREPELGRAVAALRAVIAGESVAPYSGPAFDSPTKQILADLYLACDKPAEALTAYDVALRERPRSAHSLLGAARAAMSSAQPSKAQQYYGELSALWKNADNGLPGLEEARRGLDATLPAATTGQPGRPGAP